jgi:hypothetical protein
MRPIIPSVSITRILFMASAPDNHWPAHRSAKHFHIAAEKIFFKLVNHIYYFQPGPFGGDNSLPDFFYWKLPDDDAAPADWNRNRYICSANNS